MKVKELNLWTEWDSPDIFEVTEEKRKSSCVISRSELTGLELVEGSLASRMILQFGFYGKQADGVWKHHITINTE